MDAVYASSEPDQRQWHIQPQGILRFVGCNRDKRNRTSANIEAKTTVNRHMSTSFIRRIVADEW